MTETWLKNLKSGCGAAQRPHESKMIAVSSPDHRFLTFGELAIYVRFTPERCYEAEGCGLMLLH